jgi:RNA polymerase sigma-70 factor (family 1)
MPINPLINESELLAELARGEQYALRKIYDHYHKIVYAFALWYLKSEPEAEEVMQETFLKLWLMGDTAIEIRSLQQYLKSIAGNKSLDLLRFRARRISTVSIYGNDLSDPVHNETEERIMLNDLQQIVQKGISQLPEQQKLIYQLCKEQGLKNDEVARQLNLSPHTVRTHMKLALKFLRDYMIKQTGKSALVAVMAILKIF